jgi:hypothetical protein
MAIIRKFKRLGGLILVLSLCSKALYDLSAGISLFVGIEPFTTAKTSSEQLIVVDKKPPSNRTTISPAAFYNGTRIKKGQITLVMQNSGEMGNNLCHLATARSIQLLAQETEEIPIEIIIRAQNSPKWERGAKNIKECFPKLRDVNFRAANTDEFALRQQQQVERFGTEKAQKLHLPPNEFDIVQEGLALLQQLRANETDFYPNPNATISVPYLTTNRMLCNGKLLDMYIEEIQDLFEFDSDRCCGIKPDADESVFHYRGFLTELKQNVKKKGYEEVSPNQTANVLFRHLKTGDKIAILSRFPADDHVAALRERGFIVRQVAQSAVKDFCFLLHAQKELVGTQMSTFVIWAAYLNKFLPPTILYQADSPSNRKRFNMTEIQNRKMRPGDPRQHIRYTVIPLNDNARL